MKFFSYRFILLLFLSTGKIFAQDTTNKSIPDTASILQAFKKGTVNGQARLFYMSTNNREPLTDYYALAFGGALKYQTKSFKGFQFIIGGSFTWNLSSSDLTKPDSVTGISNRYEIGQFDIENPANKKDMQRLEDFALQYNYKKSFITLGKQILKTPFVNPQDGRMRPSAEQGVWTSFNELKKTRIELGWLTHMSPRGTMGWFRGASSIGFYATGLTIDGEKSEYKNNLDSKGIAIAGINYQVTKSLNLQVWEHWVENVFNTLMVQGDAMWNLEKKKKFSVGAQYILQHSLNDGGDPDVSKTYFDPSQKVYIVSARTGYHVNETIVRLNYTRITKDGRFLFPREWGREPLYTFISRERNEGLGDVNAVTVNLFQKFLRQKLNTEISAGYYDVADVKNYRLNKYGIPSYWQLNLDMKYAFDGFMNGLNIELLYLYKKRTGPVYNDWKYMINKVDMQQLNVILNYNF